MTDRVSESVDSVIKNLESPQGLSYALSALQTLDIESVPTDKRRRLIDAIRSVPAKPGGPLFVLSLPSSIQTEMALFSPSKMLGIDRTAVRRATPNQIVRCLTKGHVEKFVSDEIAANYDFTAFKKEHWQALFLHTNPEKLPEASRPFVENKDGKGFTDDELLSMAPKCHALINFLNPNKVPFPIAYELFLTGKADLFWKGYPFASLDKTEWRKILNSPQVKIPSMFLEIARSGRFKVEELCELAIKNEQLHPFLVDLNVSPELIIRVLLGSKADYIWENYKFAQFSIADWKCLICGLKSDEILRPRAMAALQTCQGITEDFSTDVLSRNTAYAPYLPISTITPDVAVDILLRGKGHFLWSAYKFDRLNDDQWLRLLEGTTESIPPEGIVFLTTRAGAVDNARLDAVLFERSDLVEYVDAQYISPKVAAKVLKKDAVHELWERYDFSRFDSQALRSILKATRRVGFLPQSLVDCFKIKGHPFEFGDLIELATTRPNIVIGLISLEWVSSVDDDLFAQLIRVAVRDRDGIEALRKRVMAEEKSWKNLPRGKLKRLLIGAPTIRGLIDWKKWGYKDILDLAKQNHVFEQEVDRPTCFFFWRHFKSLFAMAALTAVAVLAISLQNQVLDRQESVRKHLNSIVQHIVSHDKAKTYKQLREFISTISSDDMAVVGNDLLVKNALGNLGKWEACCVLIDSDLSKLREMSTRGWEAYSESDVMAIVAEIDAKIEKSNLNRFAEYTEFEILKSKHAEYRQQEKEKTRIQGLRDRLDDIKAKIPNCEDMTSLLEFKAELSNIGKEDSLREESKKALDSLAQRIDFVRARIEENKILQNVLTISNTVYSVSKQLRKTTAVKDFQSTLDAYNSIKNMAGFDAYCKYPCYREYVRLSDDIGVFGGLVKDTADKLVEVTNLDKKFSREFLTLEGASECSNIVVYCEATITTANEKHWVAIAEANGKIKKQVERIRERDARCWNLVNKMNDATSYVDYLSARTELTKSFGQFTQLKHLNGLCTVAPSDLERTYNNNKSSWFAWGEESAYKYHYVGVICVYPDEPTAARIRIRPGTIRDNSDIYALSKSSSGLVSAELIITQVERGKYYRVDGVDYSNRQGTPLFVRSEDYLGKEK